LTSRQNPPTDQRQTNRPANRSTISSGRTNPAFDFIDQRIDQPASYSVIKLTSADLIKSAHEKPQNSQTSQPNSQGLPGYQTR